MLFFVLLHHVSDAGWSTVVRRWAEQFLAAVPLLALLFVPVLVFSGTLYILSLSGIGILGAITPIGGVALIAGWISLILENKQGPNSADHQSE